jgi:hypothetical protein
MTAAQTQQFTAAVTGTTNTGVTWSMNPNIGTLSATGPYSAPAAISSSQTVTITAISVADPSKSATATVNLLPSAAVSVSLNPTFVMLASGQRQQFAATVSGTSNTAVAWTVTPSIGTITDTGLYSAPVNIAKSQTVTIRATSLADPAKSAVATVKLSPKGK